MKTMEINTSRMRVKNWSSIMMVLKLQYILLKTLLPLRATRYDGRLNGKVSVLSDVPVLVRLEKDELKPNKSDMMLPKRGWGLRFLAGTSHC